MAPVLLPGRKRPTRMLAWILLLLAVVWIIGVLSRDRMRPPVPREDPLQTLRRRLAEGHISEEEFRQQQSGQQEDNGLTSPS